MHSEDLLIIFAKYPEAGHVKTRLAGDIGPQAACALYRLLIQTVLLRTRPDPGDPYAPLLCYTPAARAEAMRAFLEADCRYQGSLAPQVDGDLGTRMRAAFEYAFAAGARRVVIIGADAPLLSHRRILEAFARLQSVPVVLGPAIDGGYYLIGLSQPVADLFEGIPWSTDRVYARTCAKLEQLGLAFASLEVDFDIDTWADLARLKGVLEALPPSELRGLTPLRTFLESFL